MCVFPYGSNMTYPWDVNEWLNKSEWIKGSSNGRISEDDELSHDDKPYRYASDHPSPKEFHGRIKMAVENCSTNKKKVPKKVLTDPFTPPPLLMALRDNALRKKREKNEKKTKDSEVVKTKYFKL